MPARQCPYCDQPTEREHCEIHAVPTVEADLFERPPEPIREGAQIAGRYRVERFLAEGGFGAVWVARQLAMNRTVALKVLRRADRRGTEALKRFYREALTISRLAHPNIVQIFDFGVDPQSRVPFIVFELLDGRTLTDILAKHGALSEKRSVGIMAQVARALVEAHAQGVVHRDLKPNNVMVTKLRDGSRHVKVLDFGLAKIQEDGDDALTGITAPGALVGAPHFMSPEQAAGARVDFRSDLYSFGCLLHALLTARPPFSNAQAADLLAAHIKQPPPPLPPLIAGAPPSEALQILHGSLLAKNPLERPASAAVLAEILNALADGEIIDARAVLDRARKLAFAGAIPQADSFASSDALTAFADPTAPHRVPAILDEASTAPPTDPPRRANTAARREIAEVETMPPATSEPLRPLSLSTARPRERRWIAWIVIAGAVLAIGIGGGLILSQKKEPPPPPIVELDPPPPVAPIVPIAEARPATVSAPKAEIERETRTAPKAKRVRKPKLSPREEEAPTKRKYPVW